MPLPWREVRTQNGDVGTAKARVRREAAGGDPKAACLEALTLDRARRRACAEEVFRNLETHKAPDKKRLWKRLRRIARLRNKAA